MSFNTIMRQMTKMSQRKQAVLT